MHTEHLPWALGELSLKREVWPDDGLDLVRRSKHQLPRQIPRIRYFPACRAYCATFEIVPNGKSEICAQQELFGLPGGYGVKELPPLIHLEKFQLLPARTTQSWARIASG